MSHQNDPQSNDNENHLIGNILAEENSGKYLPFDGPLDSDQDEPKTFGKMTFASGYGIGGSTAPYGGAFNNIPDRVGSAPATDFALVSVSRQLTAQKFGGFGQESPSNKKMQGFSGGGGGSGLMS